MDLKLNGQSEYLKFEKNKNSDKGYIKAKKIKKSPSLSSEEGLFLE